MAIVAVVPAAGAGSRMKTDIPKQYLTIKGKTVLEYTLAKLLSCPAITRVVVVLSASDERFYQLAVASDPRITIELGGKLRAESVLAGLTSLADTDWALVHDAARPCVDGHDILTLIEQVIPTGLGGILAVPLSDTIKRSQAGRAIIDKTIDRSQLWAAVTPQLFNAKVLRQSLVQALAVGITITDEASAIEYSGGHPLLVAGKRSNLKITQAEDLSLAEFYLMREQRYN